MLFSKIIEKLLLKDVFSVFKNIWKKIMGL